VREELKLVDGMLVVRHWCGVWVDAKGNKVKEEHDDFTAYAGTWDTEYTNGFKNVYVISKKGRLDVLGAYDGAGTAQLEPVSAESLKEGWAYSIEGHYRDGVREELKLVDGMLVVRHWCGVWVDAKGNKTKEADEEGMDDEEQAEAKTDWSDLIRGAGCDIPHTKMRGITLKQLLQLKSHIEQRCVREEWVDRAERSPTYNHKLEPHKMNLYQVVDWVLLPATKARECSYVELVACEAQKPRWFVSHWWGETLFAFILCLKAHCRDRSLTKLDPYWICAYANNQWALAGDVSDDPAKSSFREAMEAAEGTVSILDSAAATYQRIWCVYEIFVSLLAFADRPDNYLYDMYTVNASGEEGVGLTHGWAPIDLKFGTARANDLKFDRERKFPRASGDLAMSIQVQKGMATMESDRKAILNSIAGKDLTAQPDEENEAYEKLNNTLRAHFSVGMWRNALEGGSNMTPFGEAMASSELKEVSLSFVRSDYFDDEACVFLAVSLPKQMVDLRMDLSKCSALTVRGFSALAVAIELRGETLEVLHLQMAGLATTCSDEVVERLADAFGKCKCLKQLNIVLAGCSEALTAGAFQKLMYEIQKTKVSLETFCLDIHGVDMGRGGGCPTYDCQTFTDESAKAMALALAEMTLLHELNLDLATDGLQSFVTIHGLLQICNSIPVNCSKVKMMVCHDASKLVAALQNAKPDHTVDLGRQNACNLITVTQKSARLHSD